MAKRSARAKRSHNAEILRRVGQIGDLLVGGLSRAQIMQFIADNAKEPGGWNASVRTIDSYIRKATVLIREEAKERRRYQLDLATMRLDDLYALCMNSQDFKTAAGVVAKQIDLFGLREAAVLDRLEDEKALAG